MRLVDQVRAIQREVGVEADGIFGPVTAGAVLAEIRNARMDFEAMKTVPGRTVEHCELDGRSESIIDTLDPKARPIFRNFLCVAKATAATYGCEYVAISGHRSWEEQDELYAQGRTKPGKIVTRARGGYSNHNFAIGADFGVFRGRVYLDGSERAEDRALAARVHAACAVHAGERGLEWGGDWKSFKDLPHFEVRTGLTMAQKRKLWKAEGSVL